MLKIKRPILLSLILGWALFLIQAIPAFGQFDGDYINGARNFLQAAESGRSQAQEFCQNADCGPDFTGLLNNLADAINRLRTLLDNPTDVEAIRATIENMTPVVQAVCRQVGECVVPREAEPDLTGITAEDADTQGVSCYRCESIYRSCVIEAGRPRDQCVQNANRLLQCWRRVPFCDWPGWPFDVSAYHRDCQDFINAGLLPNCRCACAQNERQGGCPDFFQTGLECAECAYSACQRGGDPRCSCQQSGPTQANWSYAQCDVCRWSNVGVALAALRRTLSCERPYLQQLEQCFGNYLNCIRTCIWK